jgi:hypothetical protein
MPVDQNDPRLRLADLTCDEFLGVDSVVHDNEEPDVLDDYRKQLRWRNMGQISFLDSIEKFELRGARELCDEPELYAVYNPGPNEEPCGILLWGHRFH